MGATKSTVSAGRNTEDKMRRLADDLKSSAQNGRLPCPVAFRLAKESKVPLRTVGDLANGLKVRIINCQLGCFYVEKATHEDLAGVPFDPPLKQEVQDSLVDGKLPCKAAFQVAEKLRVSRKLVGDAATKLKIKIAECQLGCFP